MSARLAEPSSIASRVQHDLPQIKQHILTKSIRSNPDILRTVKPWPCRGLRDRDTGRASTVLASLHGPGIPGPFSRVAASGCHEQCV